MHLADGFVRSAFKLTISISSVCVRMASMTFALLKRCSTIWAPEITQNSLHILSARTLYNWFTSSLQTPPEHTSLQSDERERRENRSPDTSCPLPHSAICYLLTSPLTHKSNTVELDRICVAPVPSWGWGWREEWEMMRRSMGPWAVTPLARFHIHLAPSRRRPVTDTAPPSSGRPGRFCRRGCFGLAIIRLSVGSMTRCGQRSVVALRRVLRLSFHTDHRSPKPLTASPPWPDH